MTLLRAATTAVLPPPRAPTPCRPPARPQQLQLQLASLGFVVGAGIGAGGAYLYFSRAREGGGAAAPLSGKDLTRAHPALKHGGRRCEGVWVRGRGVGPCRGLHARQCVCVQVHVVTVWRTS